MYATYKIWNTFPLLLPESQMAGICHSGLGETKISPIFPHINTFMNFYEFMNRFFSNNTAPEAKLHLKQELQMMSRAEAEGSRAEAAEPPAKLFLKAQASTSSSLHTVFDEIAKEQPQAAQPLAAGAAIELDTYLGEGPSPREDSPLKYWGVNKIRFPTLAKIARKYLSAPCSSVESERLFSSVSHIIDENRNSLTDNAEKLLFLKKTPATHFFSPLSESS